ncbi:MULTISPECIES: YciI family protein [Gordonia]|uniref:YCII-related domain-containing protein n=1 Tax=Gordonia sputi NBRC 100414 TaxID=1089453 RepID=H5TVB6_9ACTN|nr:MULTISPECIES: YciI family protein [Gordonia]NKY93167.1 hypothetical protein [Gordonia sputi]OBA31600.1 hypothetical protein A5766_13460 [Gordonia sp. 852002-51296_SCH5728562-b]OBC07142.1 hypothetical protein A5785_07895 [Gordonia sp. 852002-50395_SCH5434458]GAB37424.1 hypothetical protein GOSPT_007_00350 [Gordonia sputi NBRC 100414]
MHYILAITVDESVPAPEPGSADFEAGRQAWADYGRALKAAGVLVDGAGLQPSETATTLRLTLGQDPTVIDGPYAESKEQLAGFYHIDVADLDDAVKWAGQIPVPFGVVEVRPARLIPGADGAPVVAN